MMVLISSHQFLKPRPVYRSWNGLATSKDVTATEKVLPSPGFCLNISSKHTTPRNAVVITLTCLVCNRKKCFVRFYLKKKKKRGVVIEHELVLNLRPVTGKKKIRNFYVLGPFPRLLIGEHVPRL